VRKLKHPWVEAVVDYQERQKMISYAENFFRRMNEQKERELEIQTNNHIIAMRKVCRKIKPYMRRVAIKYIVCSSNDYPRIHVFETKSFRKAKNDWISSRHESDWYSLFAINHNNVKWEVHWCYYEGLHDHEKVIEFFGKKGEKVCKMLIKLTEWWREA
jgi:hypothetical protein